MKRISASEHYPRIGDIYLMRFDGEGSEQRGWRPGLVFQNNTGNRYSPNVIALPLTSSIKKADQVTHVLVRAKNSGLKMDSVVLCENPERVSKDRIGPYLTSLSDEYMGMVAEASILATSAISYMKPDRLVIAWEAARRLNSTIR